MDMLFLPPEAGSRLTDDSRVYWLPDAGDGAWQSLADCARSARGPIGLVLPAEVCSFFAVQLPTRKARWVDQALAYAVEELLAENVDELHLTRGEMLGDGRHRVIAVQRRFLADWLAQLQAQGLSVAAIHVDADLLPRQDMQVLFLGARALLGGAGETRLAFAAASWPDLADQLPTPRHAYGFDPEPPPGVVDYRRLDAPYRFLAAGRGEALDLAQGDFAVQRANAGPGRWKPVLAVLGLILVVQLGFMLGQAWYLERQGDAYAEASEALYRELFPADSRIVNLRAQFDEHLARGTAPSAGFLRLLDQAAAAIAEGAPVTLQQLDYTEQDGSLALQVSAPDFAALEQFRQRLDAGGQAVQLGSASREGDGVSARVVIGG